MEFATKSHPANLFQRISMPCQATVCHGILNVCWYWTRFVCLALPRRGAQTCARVCAGENCAGTGGQGARPSTCSEVRPYMGIPTHVENTSVTYLVAIIERKAPTNTTAHTVEVCTQDRVKVALGLVEMQGFTATPRLRPNPAWRWSSGGV